MPTTINQVNFSFNSQPRLKIQGRQIDVADPGTFELKGKTYRGIKLDEHTYLRVTARESGRYDMTLFATGSQSLDKWNARLTGGRVSQVHSRRNTYTLKQDAANTGLFNGKLRFGTDSDFITRFRKQSTVLGYRQLGQKLLKHDIRLSKDDLKRLRRFGELTPQLIRYLTSDASREKRLDHLNRILARSVPQGIKPGLVLSDNPEPQGRLQPPPEDSLHRPSVEVELEIRPKVPKSDSSVDDLSRDFQPPQPPLERNIGRLRSDSTLITGSDVQKHNRQQGQLYLDQADLRKLVLRARAEDNKDLLGDRDAFPDYDPLINDRIHVEGAKEAILKAFENQPSSVSSLPLSQKNDIAIEALNRYIRLPEID